LIGSKLWRGGEIITTEKQERKEEYGWGHTLKVRRK